MNESFRNVILLLHISNLPSNIKEKYKIVEVKYVLIRNLEHKELKTMQSGLCLIRSLEKLELLSTFQIKVLSFKYSGS